MNDTEGFLLGTIVLIMVAITLFGFGNNATNMDRMQACNAMGIVCVIVAFIIFIIACTLMVIR